MKLTVEEVAGQPEPELVLRCAARTPELESLIRRLEALSARAQPVRLCGRQGKTTRLLPPEELYYLESVDDTLFAYTKSEVWQLSMSLTAAVEQLAGSGVLRVGKALAVQVGHLQRLQSRMDGSIDGLLDNGEHLIISRRYARELREYLKGGEGRWNV